MVIKYQLSKYPSLTQNMVVRVWEAQSDGPSGWIYEQVIEEKNVAGVPTPGAGHQIINTITINGLDKVVHIVRLYTAGGSLLHEYNVEPTADIATIFDPIRFKIGDGGLNTPDVNTSNYTNVLLNDLGDEDFTVFRNGYGYLFPNLHYTNTGTGFVLAAPDVYNPDEEITIFRKTKTVTTVVNDSVVGKWFGGFIDVNANTSYSPNHLRKLLRFIGGVEYTFSALDAIPIGYGFCFNHLGNVAGICKINFNNAPLKWGNTTKTILDIKQFTEACFVFDGAQWNVVYVTDSNFLNQTPQNAFQIVRSGQFAIGDIPAGDPTFDIVHNLAIAGDYHVFISLQSATGTTRINDNDVICVWYHSAVDKPNRFTVCLQEKTPGVQNVIVNWLIIKL